MTAPAGLLADALGAGTGSTFTSEADLELIEGALPFTLKALEALLEQKPAHRGLHLSLAKGYLLYAYAFADLKADGYKETDFTAYQRLKSRARMLYLRSFDYARRGLMLAVGKHGPASGPVYAEAALGRAGKQDVPFLYMAGIALAQSIALAKADPENAVRLPEAAAYMQRALELDPDYDYGAIHEFFIAYEARGAVMGGDMHRAEEHFQKARAGSAGRKISYLLTYVEACSIPRQDRADFRAKLQLVRDFDIDRFPEYRLINAIAKQRAEYLRKKEDDLFLEEKP